MSGLLLSIQGLFAQLHCMRLYGAVWGFGASFVLCLLLVVTKRWHCASTMDFTDGAPIVLGLIVGWGKAPSDVQVMLTPVLFVAAFVSLVPGYVTIYECMVKRHWSSPISFLLALAKPT